MTRLRDRDFTIDPVEWGPLRFYRWRLEIGGHVAYGRTWTYRGALRDVTATAKALRMVSIAERRLARQVAA